MHGTAVLYDGTEFPYVIGTAEQVKTARRYPIPPDEFSGDSRATEFVAYLIFLALKRQGDVGEVAFEAWVETLADPGMVTKKDAEGESPAPPTA
jgi:hypothetical protein